MQLRWQGICEQGKDRPVEEVRLAGFGDRLRGFFREEIGKTFPLPHDPLVHPRDLDPDPAVQHGLVGSPRGVGRDAEIALPVYRGLDGE